MIIIIAGDFCPQHRVAQLFEKSEFATTLGEVRQILEHADYSIVNFECPITKGKEIPIDKCGPNLCCSEKGIEAIKWAGFDCITLANNHFLDYGANGVKDTLAACKKYGIDTVGGGENLQEASNVLYKNVKGKLLAVINCCEHEFSIATDTMPGSNPLNPTHQYYAIKEARSKSDYVIVIIHGGNEYYRLPSPRMKETYRFFIDAGADAVINHHQHCFSGYEIYKSKPIFYGLGNFCFDNPKKRLDIWNEGILLILEFKKSKTCFNVIPYVQCEEQANVKPMNSIRRESTISYIHKLNSIINDDKELDMEYKKFLSSTFKSIDFVLSPYSGRLLKWLFDRGIISSFSNKKKKTEMLAYIQCESQIDKLLSYLKNK